MLCEHFNTAPCVQCDIEPLEKEIEELQQLVELEAQVSSLYLKEQDQLKGQIERLQTLITELEESRAQDCLAVPDKFHVLDNHKAPRHYRVVSGDIGYINGWNDAIDSMAAPQQHIALVPNTIINYQVLMLKLIEKEEEVRQNQSRVSELEVLLEDATGKPK
jgi:hypothetical protein